MSADSEDRNCHDHDVQHDDKESNDYKLGSVHMLRALPLHEKSQSSSNLRK